MQQLAGKYRGEDRTDSELQSAYLSNVLFLRIIGSDDIASTQFQSAQPETDKGNKQEQNGREETEA